MSTITIYKRTAAGIGIVKRIGGDIPEAAPEVSGPVVDAIRETTRVNMRKAIVKEKAGRFAGLNTEQFWNVISNVEILNVNDLQFITNIFKYSDTRAKEHMNLCIDAIRPHLDLEDVSKDGINGILESAEIKEEIREELLKTGVKIEIVSFDHGNGTTWKRFYVEKNIGKVCVNMRIELENETETEEKTIVLFTMNLSSIIDEMNGEYYK